MPEDEKGCAVVFILAIVLVIIMGAIVVVITYRADNAICIRAGYDGYMKDGNNGYCYHIVDGTRVLTPISVIPKADK